MKDKNPFPNKQGWSYQFWQEGYKSADPDSSPYEKDSFPDETYRDGANCAKNELKKLMNDTTYFKGGKL